MRAIATFLSLASCVGIAGCVNSTGVVRTDLPIAELDPPTSTAPVGQVSFVAVPVQLGSFDGVQRNAQGQVIPVAVRVPQVSVPGTRSVVPPDETPALVGDDLYPTFNMRTVPLLPYGAFFVQIGNHGTSPLVIGPKDVRLIAGGQTMKPLGDSGSQEGRYHRVVSDIALQARRLGAPRVGKPIEDLHLELRRLDAAVTVAPGATWEGYVLYDTNSFNADEYNAFLQKAGAVKLELTSGGQTLATASFGEKTSPRSVVCLPGTTRPSFERCEVLAVARPSSN